MRIRRFEKSLALNVNVFCGENWSKMFVQSSYFKRNRKIDIIGRSETIQATSL